MRTKAFFFAVLAFCFFAVSCHKTHGVLDDGSFSHVSSFISLEDVYQYVNLAKSDGQTKSAIVRIEPVINRSDTVMYLVNYDEGWELLSYAIYGFTH